MTDAHRLWDGQVPFKLRRSTAWDREPCPPGGWEQGSACGVQQRSSSDGSR